MDDILDILVKIQQYDEEISNTRREIDDIPKKIASIEQQIENAQNQIAEKQDRIQQVKKTYTMKEGDIAENENKITKLNSQIFAVKTNEEYRAIVHEIEFLKTENKKIEDEMMALLEEEEKIRATLSTVETETQQFLADKRAEIERYRARTEELAQQLADAENNYRSYYGKLPDSMQVQYRKIKRVRGKAVCVVTDETCPGCSSILTPQFLNELKKRNNVLLCDNCGRMLVYVTADDTTHTV
jgi:predicted  nucleic acid-binding Zn-ribbon protein